MSNNVVLTPKVMARLTLMDLGGSLKVVKNFSTEVTQEFGKKEYKVGDTVQVRKPYRFVGGDGIIQCHRILGLAVLQGGEFCVMQR